MLGNNGIDLYFVVPHPDMTDPAFHRAPCNVLRQRILWGRCMYAAAAATKALRKAITQWFAIEKRHWSKFLWKREQCASFSSFSCTRINVHTKIDTLWVHISALPTMGASVHVVICLHSAGARGKLWPDIFLQGFRSRVVLGLFWMYSSWWNPA